MCTKLGARANNVVHIECTQTLRYVVIKYE